MLLHLIKCVLNSNPEDPLRDFCRFKTKKFTPIKRVLSEFRDYIKPSGFEEVTRLITLTFLANVSFFAAVSTKGVIQDEIPSSKPLLRLILLILGEHQHYDG